MEEHRLKPLETYNVELFNQLYQDLIPLKRRLASQIDYDRFGLTYEDMLSWFDIKFLFTFQKYHMVMDRNLLKGHLISSLSFYKNRILRVAYREQFSQTIIDLSSFENPENLLFTDSEAREDTEHIYYQLFHNYLKKELSPEAYELYQIEINPPLYITGKVGYSNKRIPASLLIEYLELPERAGTKIIKALRAEVRNVIDSAKVYFSTDRLETL